MRSRDDRSTPPLPALPLLLLPLLLSLPLGAACGGATPAVRPDDTSAEGHRQEARRESEAADAHAKRYNPGAAQPSPFRDPITSQDPDSLPNMPTYNPTDGQLREAERHKLHAQQHEAAARTLEHFESAACKDVPAAGRAACPLLGPIVDLQDVALGVRARFTEGTRIPDVLARMRCHFAYAEAHGFDSTISCPLYMRGLSIQAGTAPQTVDLTSTDPLVTKAIRQRSREEAVFVGRGTTPLPGRN
jgi:hypothetical protein